MSCGMTWRSPGGCYCKQQTALGPMRPTYSFLYFGVGSLKVLTTKHTLAFVKINGLLFSFL